MQQRKTKYVNPKLSNSIIIITQTFVMQSAVFFFCFLTFMYKLQSTEDSSQTKSEMPSVIIDDLIT